MIRAFRTDGLRFGKQLVLAIFIGSSFAYGFFVETLDTSRELLWAATLVVSILHFWYDGFIWSVRKKQVG